MDFKLSHIERFSALNPEFFQVEERSLADYLIYLKELAHQVIFVNPEMKIQGDWSVFFDNNLTVFLAEIGDFPLDEKQSSFEYNFGKLKESGDAEKLKTIFWNLVHESTLLVKTLDEWYQRAFKVQIKDDNNVVGLTIRKLVRQDLLDSYTELVWIQKRFRQEFPEYEKDAIDADALDSMWKVNVDIMDRLEAHPFLQKEEKLKGDLEFLSKMLSKGHKDFAGSISFLTSQAPRLLEDSLINHADHAPQFATLIAFLKLYENVKGDLNRITQKHLDYYYRDILGENNQEAKPDHGFVWFELAEHVSGHHLSRGTTLTAGQDEEGRDYTYKTKEDLEISHTSLSEVKVIFVSKNLLIGEENSHREVSNIFASEKIGEDGISPFEELREENIFSTFGEEQYNYTPGKQTMKAANIGFAMSSPVLLLSEGERELTFKFKFNLKSLSPLVSFLEKFSKKHDIDAETGFIKLFSRVFDIKLSTADGWHLIDQYRIYPDKDWTKGVFYVRFGLNVTDPAIVGLGEGMEFLDRFDTPWPVVEFTLTDAESMYAYSYVKDLVVDECELSVKVRKIKGLAAYNDLGQLDVSNPFLPFGPAPNIGSYLLVGNAELFKKKISELSLDVQWHNLPRHQGGFAEYYGLYPKQPSNEEFKVALSALSDFEFYPSEDKDRQQFSLYRSADLESNPQDLRIRPTQRIKDVDLRLLNLERDLDSQELPEYDGTAKAGYLKLELSSPEDPYGHDLYPDLFAKAVIKNSKSKKEEDLPLAPYAPEIRSLALNYKAQTKIVLNYNLTRENDPVANEKFYHVTPFGVKTTLDKTIPSDNHLLPQYDANGYLMLGLERVQPGQELSLYFVMRQNVSNRFDYDLPHVSWRYLVGDEWLDLEAKKIISDTTDAFTTSGIIKIELPEDINESHNILPSGKCWVEVSIDGDTSVLSKTLGIYTQAVEVEWDAKAETLWRGHNPKGSINAFLEETGEVVSVNQVEDTFAGRSRESDLDFYERISRRIKHKDRAITPSDLELIIQDWYTDLSLVRCVPAQQSVKEIAPGEAVVIVAPRIVSSNHFYLPRFSYSRLDQIASRLTRLSSPFYSFKVVNPVYEQFLITAKLKFTDERNSGDYIRRLHEDIIRKICPWFFDDSQAMSLGRGVKRDEIIAFVESREYVQFVTKLSIVAVTQDANGDYALSDTANQEDLLKSVDATSPWSVLVPVANHNFEMVDEMIHESPERAAIETMRLEGDFVIMGDDEEEEVEFAFSKDHQTYVVELKFDDV